MNPIKLKFKKEDAWFGVFWDELNIWICLIPFFPIHIQRHSICYECKKRIKDKYGGHGWHNDIKWIKYSNYTDELVTCWENHKIDNEVDANCS